MCLIKLTDGSLFSNLASYAEVVELVDTLASGASGGNPVEVQVLSSAPKLNHAPFPESLTCPVRQTDLQVVLYDRDLAQLKQNLLKFHTEIQYVLDKI